MGWGSTIVIALLTSLAGAGAAGYVGYLGVEWAILTSRGDRSGYYLFAGAMIGLLGGFVIGAVTARLVHSGFWAAQGYSLAMVAGLCTIAALFARIWADPVPTIDGERMMLKTELRLPRGWQPDNRTLRGTGNRCWLDVSETVLIERQQADSPLDWKEAKNVDGQWVAPCTLRLFSGRDDRYIRMKFGNKADVTFRVPIPAHPRGENQEWSEWTTEGLSRGYAVRCRVQRLSEFDREEAAKPDFWQDRERLIAATAADAPIASWVHFFENGNGGPAAYTLGDRPNRREVEVVKTRARELAPLLEAKDWQVVQQAVFAAADMGTTPSFLLAPLEAAGRHAIELIEHARHRAQPGDPDLIAEQSAKFYFLRWVQAMQQADRADAARPFKRVLIEVEKKAAVSQASGSDVNDIEEIARFARETLTKLAAPDSLRPAAK
jgi:hypothetical protein